MDASRGRAALFVDYYSNPTIVRDLSHLRIASAAAGYRQLALARAHQEWIFEEGCFRLLIALVKYRRFISMFP